MSETTPDISVTAIRQSKRVCACCQNAADFFVRVGYVAIHGGHRRVYALCRTCLHKVADAALQALAK